MAGPLLRDVRVRGAHLVLEVPGHRRGDVVQVASRWAHLPPDLDEDALQLLEVERQRAVQKWCVELGVRLLAAGTPGGRPNRAANAPSVPARYLRIHTSKTRS